MKSMMATAVLLLAAGSLVGASESVVRDASPAAVIAQFSQAIPPEPPVVAELTGHHQAAPGCCRMNVSAQAMAKRATGTSCSCCRKPAARSNAKSKYK